jgi:nucleotide-binding universal stress UspA family protein
MKILLAVDGSHVTKRMLSYLAAHDDLLGPDNRFSILTVVPAMSRFAGPALDRAVLDEHYKDEAEVVLEPIRKYVKQKAWQVDIGHAVGPAAETIATHAERDRYDLVVMGTHGHSSLVNLVMGSVATGVLARCKTPVLLIR